jgi:UDP-2-acetamido-3-amino-2,3-dideoxy-glucuronate N-acetyltransferase
MTADAPGLMLHPGASVADDVRFGAHVVVHDGVQIGAGATIGDGAVLGKSPVLAKHSNAPRDAPGPLVIEDGVSVGACAVVLAGARLCAGAIVGDQAYVRERAVIGPGSVVGRGSAVDNDVRVGARVRMQTNVYLAAGAEVEDDVFLGPGALTTNDDTMARQGPGSLRGVVLRRACRIGAGSVLLPGVEIGEEAFVAAGAVVRRDVAARTVVMGVPARAVRSVPDDDLLERWR